MRKHPISKRVMTILAMLALALAALPFLLTQGFAAPPVPPAAKIEPALLDRLSTEDVADWVVTFSEQADLSAAYRMNWHDRGELVYRTLQETAARSQRAAQAYLDERGLRYQTFIAGNELYVWAGDLPAVNALAELREVASIHLARTYYLDPIIAKSTDERPNALTWGVVDVKADQFWGTFSVQGHGVVVASIDTGVQWNHPALAAAFKCGGNPADPACWRDPSNICGGSACDNNGHGTHTVGTMVGDDNPALTYQAGVAPRALWIACKGCEENSCSEFALSSCADWILSPGGSTANRPHVVNNSWGGRIGTCDTWYRAKVQAWVAAGIFPAFSAGNSGSNCNTLGVPGVYQESFATAAHNSSRTIASFSSRGPAPNAAPCHPYTPYVKPNISAPGVNVCSSVPTNGWACINGTSMASPHVAGAVALLWSCNPSLIGQIDTTFQALQNTANAAPAGNCGGPPSGPGNYTYGYGYLDILAAGQSYCSPPVTPTPTSSPTPTFTPSPTRTPPPPVTPNSWANLPLVARNAQVGPTLAPTSTPTATPSPTQGTPIDLFEGFESGVVPPPGWTEQFYNANYNWSIAPVGSLPGYVRTGSYGAYVPWDYGQNEWLLSPYLTMSSGTLTVWSKGSVYWCRDTYDHCDLNVWIVVGNPGGGDDIFVGRLDDAWPESWAWTYHSFNLTPLLPGGPIRIGFQYLGGDGADVAIDDITLSGMGLVVYPGP